MTIEQLDVVPSRYRPATFTPDMEGFLGWMQRNVANFNALEQSLQLVATTGTSTTSLTVGTGSKTLTTQAGKAWAVGSFVYVVSAASVANMMIGQVTAYNSTTGVLTVDVATLSGSGTLGSWVIGLSAPLGSSAAFSGTLTAGMFELDSTCMLKKMWGNPFLQFDSGDYIQFDRGSDRLVVAVGTTERLRIDGVDGPQRQDDATTDNGLVRKSQLPGVASTSVAGLIKKSDASTTQAGTASDRAVTPADLAASMLGGVGQVMTDKTSSRSFGTTYTNSTGRPIAVFVTMGHGSPSGASSSYNIIVAGTSVGVVSMGDVNGSNYGDTRSMFTFLVPAGATYSVTYASGSAATLYSWTELQ